MTDIAEPTTVDPAMRVRGAASGEVDFRLGSFYTKLCPKFSLDSGDRVQLVVNSAVQNARIHNGAS